MSLLSSYLDKKVPSWRDSVQSVTNWGKDRLGFGGGKYNPTSLRFLQNPMLTGYTKEGDKKTPFDDTSPLAANLGLLGMLTSGAMMAPKYAYSTSVYDRLAGQLDPLKQSIKTTGEMAQAYMDPNSALNEQQRAAIRGKELSNLQDVVERSVNRSTGTYGSSVGQMMNQNVLSDAVSQALGGYSAQLGQRQEKGVNLLSQQTQLQNALSQGQMQASMAAQQAGQFMPQYLAKQFAGLLKYGMGS